MIGKLTGWWGWGPKTSIAIFGNKQILLSIDMKTKVVQQVPMIKLDNFENLENFENLKIFENFENFNWVLWRVLQIYHWPETIVVTININKKNYSRCLLILPYYINILTLHCYLFISIIYQYITVLPY